MVNHGNALELSNQEVHKVKKIQFGVLSEQDVLKMSVCEINSVIIYDKDTGLPAENAINDPRMGVTTRNIVCQSCFGDMKQCPGHFGHIKLTEPVYHIGFVGMVSKILKSVCFNCSRILLTDAKLKKISKIKNPRKRLREILKNISSECYAADPGEEQISKVVKGCGKKQPKYLKKKNEIFIKKGSQDEDEVDSKRALRAQQAYEILKRIDDETVELLGMNSKYSRPENLIIKVLAVAPPTVRPSIELSSTAKSEDDLTHMYQSILSSNMELEKAKNSGLPMSRLEEIVNRLQGFVGYLMNNEENKAKQKGGRPIKSIRQRLKGKEGRLRGNLMGKRVDFSARTVVSPDPSLELDELGVPMTVAKTLTYPEVVTQLNIEFLKELVQRGGDEWPGARFYKRKVDGKIIDLNCVNTKPNLQFGDIVERHLMNGDYVLFNRQPSLHKMSIMGHRTRILPYSTFRLNLSVTTPYNADFDGDEMNMHVPQNLESKAEIMKIMHVPRQIVTPQSNRPVMGLVQDVLLGIKLFTMRDTFVNKEDLFNILMWIEKWNGEIPKPAILKPKPLWTGKQIISMIIPEINYIKNNDADEKNFYERDNAVIIKRGELLVGTFSKPIVGSTRGSLIGCIWIDYGPEETKDFMTSAQRIINNWLLLHGFTVGIGDTIATNHILNTIEEKIVATKKEFYDALTDTQREKKKIIIHQPGKTIIESFEHKVNTLLNDCRSDIGKLLNENIGKENNIKTMILAGSKGTNINISQISGLVGQQNVEGRRIPFGFLKRSLPHFLKDDYGPESKGFVANSYYKGLTPEEFFFHTMGGREGLIDTAVKTSQTGYMQRRLVKAMEDVMVQYDSTVRDSYGNIVQFLYGEDGIAGEYIEEQYFDLLTLPEDKLRKTSCFFEIDASRDLGFEDNIQKLYESEKITTKVREELLKNKEAHRILQEEYQNINTLREELHRHFTPATKYNYLPVNIGRLVTHALYNIPSKGKSDLNPIEIVEEVKKLAEELTVVNGDDEVAKNVNSHALKLFKAFLYFSLSSKRVVLDYKLSSDAFKFLLNEIRERYQMSLVHPGEMVGSIAAQSMGETLTQMTLNTFHFAGVSSQNITLGVPRIQEIINCANNIKGPSMTIYLKDEYRFDVNYAHKLISLLEFTTLKHVAKVSEIYYDPNPSQTIIVEDQDLLWFDQDGDKRRNHSPWVLRILIDPVALGRKGLRFKEIIRKIETFFAEKPLEIIESLESADPIVLRLRIKNDHELTSEEITAQYHGLKKIEQYILEDLPIKGFCKKVSYKREPVKAFSAIKGVETIGDKEGEYILETSGTDIARVLSFPFVDTRRTTTNHVMDIYKVLGIEATREAILREIRIVFYFFEIYVNYRHTILLADVVTAAGKPMSISRNGINRVYQSVLRKSSFEETVEIFLEASAFAELDELRGVTENVMLGQLCRLGTGCFDVMMDQQYFFPKSDKDKEKISSQWKYFPDLSSVLEVDGNIEDGEGPDSKTPYAPHTPAHHTDYRAKGTPAYEVDAFPQSPQPYGGITPKARTPIHNNPPSPHRTMYSPAPGDQTTNMSPLLPINSRPMSPSMASNINSTNNMFLTGTDHRYTPLSPQYAQNASSPNRALSPGAPNRHYSGMSPSYSYNSPSSPNYSPNSSGSPSMSQQNSGSSLHTPDSPFGGFKATYDPASPAYNIAANLIRRNEEKYSDESDSEDK